MKHVILVRNGSVVIGVASNLKKALDLIESNNKKGYSTIALTISFYWPYRLGSGKIQGIYYENIVLEKYRVNTFPG